MTTLPAAGYFTASGRKNSEGKQGFDDMLAVIRELAGGEATSILTIAAGSVTPVGATHTVDTEAAAATDNLDNITQTNLPDGRHLFLFPENIARVVTLRHNQGGAGEILLVGGASFTLDTADSWVWLRGLGTTWKEVLRSSSAGPGAVSSVFTRTGAVAAAAGDYTAAEVTNVAAGNIAAIDVQAALNELDTEKAALSHTHPLAEITDEGALAALNTVGTPQIDNAAVTLAKMANMATASLLGRNTVGAGVPEVLSKAIVLALLNVADGANAYVHPNHTGDVTSTGDGATVIGASKVTPAMLTKPDHAISIAASDETTAITTGLAKVTFRMPFAMTLSKVKASLTTASSSGIPTVDINESGVSILSTKLTIDATEKTSETAATAAVISDTALAADAEITIDIDVAGTGAKGLKVYLIGKPA